MASDELLNLTLPIPTKQEQDQIVNYLDWKTTEIDRFIQEKKKQIKKLEELKASKIDTLIIRGKCLWQKVKTLNIKSPGGMNI